MEDIHKNAEILKKLLTGEAGPDEQAQGQRLLQNRRLKQKYEELKQPHLLDRIVGSPAAYDADKAFQRFLQAAAPPQRTRKPAKRTYILTGIAASIALIAGLWIAHAPQQQPANNNPALALAPGQTKGTLVLGNGQQVELDSTDQTNLADRGATASYTQGRLSYHRPPATALRLDRQTIEEQNQFIIPSGAENSIVLSDGTHIRLNAESRLIYPTRFGGETRTVFLEGEAYFDVAPDAGHPFIVQTRMGEIKVLGTRFNVNIYPENTACYTTLVEGKVLAISADKQSTTLLPGEQAILSEQSVRKHKVNPEEYIGWVKGVYTFRNQSLHTIMHTFERWYNMEVVFEDASLAALPYTGSVKRYQSIRPFLEALQLTTDLHYRIEGRKVYLGR